jgi:hypothetical protein
VDAPVVIERVRAPGPLDWVDHPSEAPNPVASLRSMLVERGWVEQPPDGVMAHMWFEFPDSLVAFAPTGPADPDGIGPATVLVIADSVDDQGFLRDFRVHVELAGRNPGVGTCAQHTAPAERTFCLDEAGLAELAAQLDEIEGHVANWAEIVACADGDGRCA